jgi:protease-4
VARRRGIVIVLSMFGLVLLAFVGGVATLAFIASRGPSIPDEATLVLRPQGSLQEVVPNDLVGQLLGRDTDTIGALVNTLRLAKRDERVQRVLLMPANLDVPYWGKLQELREAVLDFRSAGKSVVAFLEYGADREYYLASAADQIYLLPTSPLDLTGVASYELFLRGLLDKVGATPDFIGVGAYKTAPNQLTERGMTPAHREMAESLNRDLYDQLVRGIAEGRKKSEADVRALLDEGPFAPDAALRAGLVDGLAYEDELDDHVPDLRDDDDERRIAGATYRRVPPGAVGIRPRTKIAVLYAVGTIVAGRSGFDPLNGDVIGSDTLVEQIRRVRDDETIEAIVLRVDSPGGSAVASDIIWRELMITRRANPDRPLVTSMSDLAASGGYYLAMAGQAIVAQPATLTGSIGIYGGKVALGGAADKLGVNTETVKSGANADIYSPFAPFSPAQREKLLAFMQSFYDGFVEKAAESRGMTPAAVDAVAQGRVWTGAQARTHGLVDELGGLAVAVRLAKERAGIPADEEVELVAYPPRRTLLEVLSQELGGGRATGLTALLAGQRDVLMRAGAPRGGLFRRGEPLALMPTALAW